MVKERKIQQYKHPEAQISDQQFESLVKEYRQSMLACASRTVKHFVTEQDEEWSVTLQAFYEAVKGYDSAKGEFWPFTSVIIRRRLTDWMRDLYRHREEEQEEVPETVQDKENWPGQYTIKDEIEAVQGELKAFGFSFFDLVESSPKAEKSRKKCAAVIASLVQKEELFRSMKETGTLPMKSLIRASGISGKVIEKHRRYIIAAAIILQGEYPLLAEYLHVVREEMKA